MHECHAGMRLPAQPLPQCPLQGTQAPTGGHAAQPPNESDGLPASGVKPPECFRPPSLSSKNIDLQTISARTSVADSEVDSELDPRPRIDNWAAVFDTRSCPFQAPELRPIYLTGTVTNHTILPDGPISTSIIQMIDVDRGIAMTRSTEYVLGKRSAKYELEIAMCASGTCGEPHELTQNCDPVSVLPDSLHEVSVERRKDNEPSLQQRAEQPQRPMGQEGEMGDTDGTVRAAPVLARGGWLGRRMSLTPRIFTKGRRNYSPWD